MGYVIILASIILILAILSESPKKKKKRKPTPSTASENHSDNVDLFIFRSNKKGYMNSDVWNSKRIQVLKRDKFTCQSCGITSVVLEVHHMKDYKKLGNEPLESLVTLCRSCHLAWHTKYGYPTTFQDYMNWNFSEQTIKDLHKTI